MVHFIRSVIQPEVGKSEKLLINVQPNGTAGPPAKVTFDPLTLHVRASTWRIAEFQNSPLERYILGHECGHILLHDGRAKGFSSDPASRVSSVEKFRSAEWQADRFADFLLMPTIVAERYSSAHQLGIRAGVPEQMAKERLSQIEQYWRLYGRPYGLDYCTNCFCSDTARIGSRTKCKSCGIIGTLEL
ncbi:ImmA/IrrE family metallo-endopeptidase [Devosia psychrophila]|uniref:Uncharacterized protein n=1 Tax=Devosia psychrophila TaxID=728005 RepID=A0A1I1KTH0_9HYPH|nr:protein of unknown function [Devosia psychrophila]